MNSRRGLFGTVKETGMRETLAGVAEVVSRKVTPVTTPVKNLVSATRKPFIDRDHRISAESGETTTSTTPKDDFVMAWSDLQKHPALLWVPPLWRSDSFSPDNPSPDEQRHAVRAIDRNLIVHVYPGDSPCIELALGPLKDRQVGSRVDPTTPSIPTEPRLKVCGPSFEEAVVELRDVVYNFYGDQGELTDSDPVPRFSHDDTDEPAAQDATATSHFHHHGGSRGGEDPRMWLVARD